MRIVQTTLLVAVTLFLLVIFWPLIPWLVMILIGSNFGRIILFMAPFAILYGVIEGIHGKPQETGRKTKFTLHQ